MNPANQPRGPSGKRTTDAFTLLELMVVIAITALLAAILLPSFAKAKFSSQVTACASNFRQWGYACAAYASENQNGYYPSFPMTGFCGENVTDVTLGFLTNMHPYGLTAPMYFCPARTTGMGSFNDDDSQWFAHSHHHIVTYVDLSEYYVWFDSEDGYDFIRLDNICFWVPRLDPAMNPPNYFPWSPGLSNPNDSYDPQPGTYNPIDIANGGWPLRTSDPAAAKQPVITDYCLANGGGIVPGTGHWFNGTFTGVNAGFADGRVEMHPPALVTWHMSPGWVDQAWMY
jgi:prepilin-type N-terminal cleavage/methylation domain-containing protein